MALFLGFFSLNTKLILNSKEGLRIMLGLGHRSSCREAFKRLDILTIPSLYIYAMIMFVIRNTDICQTSGSLHGINTRQENKLRISSVKFSSIQKGVLYSSIKISSKLTSDIVELPNNTNRFQSAQRKYLVMSVFYSVDEFLSTSHILD
jgi:hypothetical protein